MSGTGHHIIPRLHLRHFADNRGHVWTYNKEEASCRSAIPEETAKETHFYSYQLPDGSMNMDIDTYITNLEGLCAPIYQNLLIADTPPVGDEKYDFAHFLALMHYRTRAMKRILSELYARELQIESYKIAADDVAYARWLENYEQGNNKTYTAAEAEELRAAMMDYSGYTFEVPKNHWLAAFQGIDKLAKVFYQLNWRIGEAKHHYFITADVPVAKNTDGFVHPLTTVTMPLSRKRILIMSRRPMKQGIVALDRDTVIGENQNRASHAERELYAHIKHKDLVRLAKNNKSAGAQLIYSGFGPKNYADVQVPRKWQVDST